MTTTAADIRKIPRLKASSEKMPRRGDDYAKSEEKLLGEGLSEEQIARRQIEAHARRKELLVVGLAKAAIAGAGVAAAIIGAVSIVFATNHIEPKLLNAVAFLGAAIGVLVGFLIRRRGVF